MLDIVQNMSMWEKLHNKMYNIAKKSRNISLAFFWIERYNGGEMWCEVG